VALLVLAGPTREILTSCQAEAAVPVVTPRHAGAAVESGLGRPSMGAVGTLGGEGVEPSIVCVTPLLQ
jgi:hypothetical protein